MLQYHKNDLEKRDGIFGLRLSVKLVVVSNNDSYEHIK